GLSGSLLDDVVVEPHALFKHDRHYALSFISSFNSEDIDPTNPLWSSKRHFLNLVNCPMLATLKSKYDFKHLHIMRNQKTVVRADLTMSSGRLVVDQFFNAWLANMQHLPTCRNKKVKILQIASPKHGFSDQKDPLISLINLASMRDLERVLPQKEIHPLRFRGNIYVDHWPAWYEGSLIGKKLKIGDVEAVVCEPIERCQATNVNPDNGEVDLNIPLSLKKGFDHINCGVFLRIEKAGQLKQNMPIQIID
ncbi:MAG: MOSC domain-containing protein, partial [Pseudomonadota bacterium]